MAKKEKKPKFTQAVLVFPNQLFREHPAMEKNRLIVLAEDWLFFRQFAFHKQKLILHRASMKAYEERLKKDGYSVLYLESSALATTEQIFEVLEGQGIKRVHIADTADDWLEQFLDSFANKHDMDLSRCESPLFLTPRPIIEDYYKRHGKFSLPDFYQFQRKRLGVLVTDSGRPVGGRWMLDSQMRKTLPEDIQIPGIWKPSFSLHVREAIAYVEKNFPSNPGMTESFFYPVTHADAKLWFNDFLEHRLQNFCFYRDAVKKDELFLFHSVLSPALNIGLLTPKEVIKTATDYAANHSIPLKPIETFVRQIVGWREYMYATYLMCCQKDRSQNVFLRKRKMPLIFWEGDSGIEPFDTAVRKMLYFGYTHRIDRLLAIGYFLLLCEIDTDEVFKFMMSLSIDAYDWVVAPNVYSITGDILIADKKYFCGARYLLEMGDYEEGWWSRVWNGLHWRFVKKNREFLEQNKKFSFAVTELDKIPAGELAGHLNRARAFLARLARA